MNKIVKALTVLALAILIGYLTKQYVPLNLAWVGHSTAIVVGFAGLILLV